MGPFRTCAFISAAAFISFILGSPLPVISQPEFFREDMGTPLSSTLVSNFAGWRMQGVVQFEGNAQVRSTLSSQQYPQASGSGNVFFTTTPGHYLLIRQIPIALQRSLLFRFGVHKSSTQSSGMDFIVEWSINETDFEPIPLALPVGVGTAVWSQVSFFLSIPPSPYLFLRFRQSGSTTFYRVDDITLSVLPPLPVRISAFSISSTIRGNLLLWETSSEQNNAGFRIERSLDGINFQSIGFVNSLAVGGNSQSSLKYSFVDPSPMGIKQYYRLKQMDIDGRSSLSNILLVQRQKPTTLKIASVFPNPSRGQVTMLLSAPANETVSIRVLDLTGRILETRQVNVLAGNNSIPFDLSKRTKGTYLISVGERTIRVVRE